MNAGPDRFPPPDLIRDDAELVAEWGENLDRLEFHQSQLAELTRRGARVDRMLEVLGKNSARADRGERVLESPGLFPSPETNEDV